MALKDETHEMLFSTWTYIDSLCAQVQQIKHPNFPENP